MGGADPAEVRARLKAAGIEVPARGRISRENMTAFDELAAADAAAGVTVPQMPADPGEPGEEPGAPADVEVRPKRPRAAPAKSLAERIRSGRGKGSARGTGKRPGRARPAQPRVSVAGTVEWCWGILARAAQPVSVPLSRCLAMQSPVAGLVLEDAVKGTVVDRVLQPIARGQERMQTVGALILLPVAIAGLEAAEGLAPAAREVRRAFLIPIAREGAAMWIRVAGPKIQERIEQEAEQGPVYAQADQLLVMMEMPFLTADDLGIPDPYEEPAPPAPGPAAPEEERARAAEAAQRFAGTS